VSAQLLSRIMLSTLCLAAAGAGVYSLTAGELLFGLVLLALGGAALLWLWKPWQYLSRKARGVGLRARAWGVDHCARGR
jgi:hypothetical protein